jgi:PRD1 phage membrane DNA delivery
MSESTNHAVTAVASIVLAIMGLAVIALLVATKAQTGSVIQAGGSAFDKIICVALSPVAGSGCVGLSNSGFTTDCVMVEGKQYCPNG